MIAKTDLYCFLA